MNRFFKTVLLTGLFVGTTDLVSAYISVGIKTGKLADKMLNYIAGGVLGLDVSMTGGNAAAFLGLFIHYFIAFSFTLFFFWVFPKLRFLSFNKYMVGMLYGVFANLVVWQIIWNFTPLPRTPFNLTNSYIAWLILGVALGIPIAYNTYKYYGVETPDPAK